MDRIFGGYIFNYVGLIEPDREMNGVFCEFLPQDRYKNIRNLPLNPHGAGPFCRFKIANDVHHSGVYVLTLNENPIYIGKCDNLAKRWGPQGYGSISPKNCFKGGQSTNCKINSLLLEHSKRGEKFELWFYAMHDPGPAERILIINLKPEWNSQIPW